jgi:cell division protein FtsW
MKFLKWFYSIDNKLLTAIITLMICGFIMTMAASPAVAERISVGQFHFIEKQLVYLLVGLLCIIAISSLNERVLKKIIFCSFLFIMLLLVIVLFAGDSTKGAKRWLNIFGFSLQPSEFLKPFYSCIVAIVLARSNYRHNLEIFLILVGLHIVIMFLLLMQPDFGMSVLISTVFGIQLFIAEVSILWLLVLGCIFLSGVVMVYYLFPHVAARIEKFLASSDGTVNYQVQKSLDSYASGGLWGRGPGEGTVKFQLPDAHTDFIFPVAAEELGMIFCIVMIMLMVYIVLKTFTNIVQIKYSLYRVYCATGLISYFAIQSIFNIAVTLNLVPTKGMTLPFISYGGSSLIAQALSFGIYLNITKNSQKIGLKKNTIHVRL